jgi:hypothetical protein
VGADDQVALIPETEHPQAAAGFELKEAFSSSEVLEFGVIGGWSLVGGEGQQSQQLLEILRVLLRLLLKEGGRAMARMVNRTPWRMGSVLRLTFTYK